MLKPFLRILALSILTAAPSGSASSNEFAAPSQNLLYQLQKRNQGQPWLRVATDSSQLMLKARRIDELGLGGLKSPKSDPPAPSLIAWRSIARIDEFATHETAGKVTGFLVGGTAGMIAGVMSSDVHQQAAAMLGVALLGGLCAWQGGHIGKRMVDERQWYVGTPREAAPPLAVDTSTAPAHSSPAPTPPSTTVLKACSRVDRNDYIRMRGHFGQFQGYASVVGPEGLEGLRADHGGHSKSAVPAGLVMWDQIDRMEKRGGSAGKGARYGAVWIGLLGGMTGGAAAAAGGGTDNEVAGGVAAGAAVGALLGAGIGALFGGPIPAWHVVYERPPHKGSTSK
jgi:hypothetical protein